MVKEKNITICNKEIEKLVELSNISRLYYTNISEKLEIYIDSILKDSGYIQDKNKIISYCSDNPTVDSNNLFNFAESGSIIDADLKKLITKKNNNQNVGLYNNSDKKAFLTMLLLRTGDFITIFCTFLLNIFKNIRYSIHYKKFLLTSVNSYYIEETDIPPNLLYSLDGILQFICKHKMDAYNWIFFRNKYTHEFKYFIKYASDTFIRFIMNTVKSNIIQINPEIIICDNNIFNIKTVNSIVNYFVIINQFKTYMNDVLTSLFTCDNEYMTKILDLFTSIMEKHGLDNLYIKGGHLYKINTLNFIKNKPNIKLYDENNKLVTSDIKFTDWDFAYNLNTENNFTYEYKKYADKVQAVFHEFRQQEQKHLDEKYIKIMTTINEVLINNNNKYISIKENSSNSDQKIYYAKNTISNEMAFDDFIFDDKLDNIKDRYELLKQLGADGYNLQVVSNDKKNKHKITHLEIYAYTNNKYKVGINLIRFNSKFNINLKLDEYLCINFLSIAEIFDITVNKPNSFNNIYDKENITDAVKYTMLKYNGKSYKSYSLIWYVLDVIYTYINKAINEIKKIVRMFNAIIMLLHTNKKEYNYLFNINKHGKSVKVWLNEIADNYKDKLINYKKYKDII